MLQTTLKFCLGYNTGSSLNPASDFGPRVVAYAVGYRTPEIFSDPWWIYGPVSDFRIRFTPLVADFNA